MGFFISWKITKDGKIFVFLQKILSQAKSYNKWKKIEVFYMKNQVENSENPYRK